MPYKDPEQKRRYQREWKAMRKAGRTRSNLAVIAPAVRIKTAEDVLKVLEQSIAEVQAIADHAPATVLAKARTLATVSLAVLKALETGVLEKRIADLEAIIEQGGRAKWC